MKYIIFVSLSIISLSIFSQNISKLRLIEPHEKFDNILVKKLDTDSNSTSFVIWVKDKVKSHKHETHSELIYVIDGNGIMTVNKNTFNIETGDYFRIPENTFHSLIVTSENPIKVLSVQSPEFLGKDRVFEKTD